MEELGVQNTSVITCICRFDPVVTQNVIFGPIGVGDFPKNNKYEHFQRGIA